jgi:hypothetical protein
VNLYDFSTVLAIFNANSCSNSSVLHPLSLLRTEQGIFSREQGISCAEQGILQCPVSSYRAPAA